MWSRQLRAGSPKPFESPGLVLLLLLLLLVICSASKRKRRKDRYAPTFSTIPDAQTDLVPLTRRGFVLPCFHCMSARRIDVAGSFPQQQQQQQLTVEARQTRLSLSPNSVIIHK